MEPEHGSDGRRTLEFRWRESPEDFVVEELDEHAASGEGAHLLVRVRAKGIGTLEAARRLARRLDVDPGRVSFAGRKDVHATAIQRLGFEHGDAARLAGFEDPALEVLEVTRHGESLRLGQLRGNRFSLVLTGVEAGAGELLARRLAALAARGMPNAFGPQRYGRTGATAELGRLLVRGDALAYLDGLAAASDERHREAALELARRARHGTPGERRRATELCRGLDPDLAAVARQLARRRDDPAGLVRALPKAVRGLHLSALQSRVFDAVLGARASEDTFDVPLVGDVLMRPGRGPFVLRREAGRPRGNGVVAAAAAFALDVSGPMWSPRMVRAEGEPGRRELAALAAEGLAPEDLDRPGGLAPKGARRPLRARVGAARLEFEAGGDGDGPPARPGVARLEFTLPPGAYATTLLACLRTGAPLEPLGGAPPLRAAGAGHGLDMR